MRVLGALLAGGRSRRFGSDKALALLDGEPLIAHVAAALAAQTEALVVCGRAFGPYASLPDRPPGGHGPLAGLAAALHAGRDADFAAVLSVPCDTPVLPRGLRALLAREAGQATYLAAMPVIGLWPCGLAPELDDLIATGDDRSMRAWIRRIGAVPQRYEGALANVNTPGDLVLLQADGH